MKKFLFRNWVMVLMTALLAFGFAEGLHRNGSVQGAEMFYSDLWHRLAGVREVPEHVALVMLDDPSLNDYPDDPLVFWTPQFAKAVAVLKQLGAKAVAIDFLFSASPERWIEKLGEKGNAMSRSYDQAFREQINGDNVQLSAFKVGEGASTDDFILPNPDYLLALPNLDMPSHIGLVNLYSDADGTVRRMALIEAKHEFALKQGLPRLSFGALAAIRASAQDVAAGNWRFGDRKVQGDDNLRIHFSGPPGTFAPISFRDLLADNVANDPQFKALAAKLANKVVVIGAGYAGMNDVHPVPYSTGVFASGNRLMAGPEIQANIIEALIDGKFIDDVPATLRIGVFALVFAGMALVALRLPFSQAVVLVVFTALVASLLTYLLFKQDLLFPLAHLQGGMLVILVCTLGLRLTREETRRRQLNQMFGRYVSPQVMSAMLDSPNPPELGGQSRQVSVLFSDVRGFTTLSEKLTAQEVVELLNNYFERACACLMEQGATIDKFIGDAIMVEFGAPLDQTDHALRAVRGALALRAVAVEFRHWFNERFPDRGLHEFDVGIGVHTGTAVVGNIGSSSIMEYTAIGDTVNIASRLEGLTKDLGCPILASRETVEAAGGKVKHGQCHSVKVKGREQPVEVFEILGVED